MPALGRTFLAPLAGVIVICAWWEALVFAAPDPECFPDFELVVPPPEQPAASTTATRQQAADRAGRDLLEMMLADRIAWSPS